MKKPKTLYRFDFYELKVIKQKVTAEVLLTIEMEKDIPGVRKADALLYRIRDGVRTDFAGFSNRKAAIREGIQMLQLEVWKLQAALDTLKEKEKGL